jgi:hypothetical protein
LKRQLKGVYAWILYWTNVQVNASEWLVIAARVRASISKNMGYPTLLVT